MTSRPGAREAATLSCLVQKPSQCPPSHHHSPETSGGPADPVSSELTAGSFQGWTLDRNTQATWPTGATAPTLARPGCWKPQGECAGDTEWPRPKCTQHPGCLLWADVLLWPTGPASHPAPRVSGQGPHALQARVLVPAQRPMPDSQAGLDPCAPAYTGAVGLSPPLTQSPVPGEHTSNGSVGGKLRLDCTEAGCDVHSSVPQARSPWEPRGWGDRVGRAP